MTPARSIKLYHLTEPLAANGRLVHHAATVAGMCRGVRHIDRDEAEEDLKFTKRLRVFFDIMRYTAMW